MSSHIQNLIDLAKEPSSAKRRELLREITNIFLTSAKQINAKEMALYDAVLSQLTFDMEMAVRQEISEKLCETPFAPKAFLQQLAMDQIEVAEPVLSKSQVLDDDDLLQVVTTQGQGHLRAVSRRTNVSEAVSSVIVDRGDDTTLMTLLSNDGARLSRLSSAQAVGRAKDNPELHEVIIGRNDLPTDLLNDMYFVVEARLRERILEENAKLDPNLVEEAIERGRNRLAVAAGAYPADYETIAQLIKTQFENQQLTPALLARYMRDANATYFLCALELMADIDFLTAKLLVDRKEIDGLAIACKAAGLDKSLFLTYAMIMLSGADNAMGKAAEYGKLYTQLPTETALRTIRFWRLRRAEGRAA